MRDMLKKKKRTLNLEERLREGKQVRLNLGEEALNYFGWSILPQESV